jgi:polysaccharide biosynthesis protein PslG
VVAIAIAVVTLTADGDAPRRPATTAHVPFPPIIGIVANTVGYRNHAGVLQDRVRRTGVRWLREELDWDAVEFAPGRYDWSRYDVLYRAAAHRRLHILPLIMTTPRWAGPSPTALPADPATYASFVAAVVKRYGPGGAFWTTHPRLRPVPSTWFELWNEPWTPQFSGGHPDPAAYALLVAAAGPAAHHANPAARVLIASDITPVATPTGVVSWTDAMYEAVPTLSDDFDAVAIHPYGGPDLHAKSNTYAGRFREDMEDVRADFVAHGAAAKPFWLTEIGWSTCPAGAAAFCVSERQQAALVTQLFRLLATTYRSYVAAAFLYHYNDFPHSPADDREGYFGITRVNGSHKPSYRAFERALRGADNPPGPARPGR